MKGRHTKQILCVLIAALLWGLFAATRFGPFTTYIPLSGRLFSVDPAQTDTVFVQNGTTGEQHFFETEEEKAAIAAQLEALRYRFWFPDIPVARGGWSWRVALETGGNQYTFYFGDGYMTVNGIVYLIPKTQFDALRAYVEP